MILKLRRGSRNKGLMARAAPAMALYLILLMLLSSIPVSVPAEASAHTSSRIIVISNETAIPIALGTPTTGLEPFTGVLVNKMGVYITGQVVDGNYTPIWQPGSRDNNAIGDVMVHWSFGAEPDRAHTEMTDGAGHFSFYLTPDIQGTEPSSLKFWFDGKTDSVYGIPIYPSAEIVYEIDMAQTAKLVVNPVQSRAMAGDTILVQGRMTEPDGTPVVGEGLMAFFNGAPAQENPHAGWYIDNVVLGPFDEDFEDGTSGFESGGRGSEWSSGLPMTGPKGGAMSINCAGTDLDGNYEYDTDSWFTTPTIDLYGYDPGTLSFDTWSDIAPEDPIQVQLSNDDGLTWPVSMDIPSSGSWQTITIPVGTYHNTPYGTVEFANSMEVKARFRLTSNVLPLKTDADGRFEFEYDIPPDSEAGPATITIEHPASNRFAKTTSTAKVSVARMTLIETIAPENMYRATPVEVRARVLDIDGTLMRTALQAQFSKLMFYLNQGATEIYLGERNIDGNGYAAIGYEPSRTNTLGPASFRVLFKGNEFYSPSEATSDTIVKAHTEVEILAPIDASLLTADKIEITGTVHVIRTESINDVNKDPVSKKDVRVLLNGEEIGTATTDMEGLFSLEFDSKSSGVNLGNAVITVNFPGDLVYEPSEDTVDFSILSATEVQIPSKTIMKGSTVVIEGTLTSMEGGVQGIVEIEVGGPLYKKVVTSSKGRFATTYQVPWDANVGGLPITVRYGGNTLLKPSMTTINYIVYSETKIEVGDTPLTAERGTTVALKGTLKESWQDEMGLGIAGEPVILTFPDGEQAQTYTGVDGNFTYHYTVHKRISPYDTEFVPDIGEMEVQVSYSGFLRQSCLSHFKIDITSQSTIRVNTAQRDWMVDEDIPIYVSIMDDHHYSKNVSDIEVLLMDEGQEIELYRGPVYRYLALETKFNESGTYTIMVRFGGDEYLGPSEEYLYIKVKEPHTEPKPLYQQPTVILGGGVSIVVVLAIFLTESGKYVLFKLILVPMYTKLKKTDVLDHFVRGQIYGLVRMHPGAHYNLIKKKLDLKNGVLSYHLSTLEREGYVISEIDGIYKRFFPNHVKFEADFPIFLSKVQERILDFIRVTPGSTQKEVAKGLRVSTSTVNDNIKVLTQNQLVQLKRDGKRTKCFVVEG